MYSACPNLLGPDEELVAAWDAIRNVKQPNNLSGLRFYVKRLEDLGLDADATMTDLYRFFRTRRCEISPYKSCIIHHRKKEQKP